MRFPKSIRWRLQLWYGVLLFALLCGFGFTAFHLEKTRQLRRIDEGLQLRISALVDALRAAPPPERGAEKRAVPRLRLSPEQAALFGGGEGYYFAIWMQGAEPISASPNAPALLPKPASGEPVTRTRGDFRESHLSAAPVNFVLVGRSIAAEQSDFQRLAGLLAVIGIAVLAAGLVGGWWLAGRAIRPVEDIGAAAVIIADGDLSRRIDTAETDSELGLLAGLLNSTFAKLEAAFARQTRFTADAAHELRTPVSVILTQTQSALARERSADEYRETIEACLRATQRMRRLIDSLLTLARLDADPDRIEREACDLSAIAGEVVEMLRPLASERRISMLTDFAPALCQCDSHRLALVATNLITNAIEYNHEGGEVRVSANQVDGAAILTVINTGPEIPPDDLPHIFERFYRADKARTGSHSGLGLAITEAIVKAHGGSIEAASDPREGTTFTVSLPFQL